MNGARLKTQQNERRCKTTQVEHILDIAGCCPVSKNPVKGSCISIRYVPNEFILEVFSLRRYIDSYIGGREDIRSMEGMIQAITRDCAEILQTEVIVTATLKLFPHQFMNVTTTHGG